MIFMPNGRELVSVSFGTGSYDGVLRFSDVESGQSLHNMVLHLHTDYISTVAFSPNGQLLASGAVDGSLRLWDVASGQLIHTLAGHTDRVQAVAFSSDGQQLASGSRDNSLRLWDVRSGEMLQLLKGDFCLLHAIEFSPDKRQIIPFTIRNKTLQLWNTENAQLTVMLEGGAFFCRCAFSPDGKHIAAGDMLGGVHLLELVDYGDGSTMDEAVSGD